MTVNEFKDLLKCLTGRSIRTSVSDDAFLERAVQNDEQVIDCSQFNELLLIANKDRVEAVFFEYFFVAKGAVAAECSIGDLRAGVEKFQKTAMVRFGNFIYAYRTLSKFTTLVELKNALGAQCKDPNDLKNELNNRRPSVLEVIPIDHQETYLLGYISSGEIRQEHKIATGLDELLHSRQYATWDSLNSALVGLRSIVTDSSVINRSINLVERFRTESTDASVLGLQQQIKKDLPDLTELNETLKSTERTGVQNTDIYLTWDHMDLYFATSMRKRWEYEDLFHFVHSVMEQERLAVAGNKTLRELNVRHFDPTQSFDKNRINKGLIESLMLKRAACTVYSVQDTDTLGKDSELAATLAQGKPVIAYAPEIDVKLRVKELGSQSPETLLERLQFVLYADGQSLSSDLSSISNLTDRLKRFENERLWRSVMAPSKLRRFQQENKEDIEKLCHLIATSERRIYDKRALTLKKTHPLAIQVNLETGVANGVIVVRSPKDCSELIWRILTNTMTFDILLDPETDCWLLREELTQSIYRVVTNNPKLTNCFWNFYPESRTVGRN